MTKKEIIVNNIKCPVCGEKPILMSFGIEHDNRLFNKFKMQCKCGCIIKYKGSQIVIITEKDW